MRYRPEEKTRSLNQQGKGTHVTKQFLVCALLLSLSALYGCGKADTDAKPPASPASSASSPGQSAGQSEADIIKGMLSEVLASYRKTIVLFADDASAASADPQRIQELGHELFHANLARTASIQERMFNLLSMSTPANGPSPYDTIAEVLDYVESDPAMFDADRLAFKEILQELRDRLDLESTLGGARLRARVDDDLRSLEIIERNYDKELRGVYGRAGTRAIDLKRERWSDYVSKLRSIYSIEQLLKAAGTPQPGKPASAASSASTPLADPDKRGQGKAALSDGKEIFGYSLPPKVVALTFDDGPHHRYTKDIVEILGQYGARATFFQVGSNLGTIDKEGQAQLGKGGQTARFLESQGHAIANHSMTHAKLSALSGQPLKNEVLWADALLRKVDASRPPLFRFPYGARNQEAERVVDQAGLRSIMWNVDSLDWADPIPSSIADRVLRSLEKEGRGIILFHDIHERTVKALPLIMSRLAGQGYQFAGWDGKTFSTASAKKPQPEANIQDGDASPVSTGDRWAVVVGIDEYSDPAWPKLKHAVADAKAFKELLVSRFGYKPDRIVTLFNKEATRPAILSALDGAQGAAGASKNKPLTGAMKPGDSLVFFYAGHGSTRKLSSGRDLGYIVPVDSTADLGTDAIPMSELQNVSEGSVAKHAMFIMDACYSGLGLTRGTGGDQRAANFLRENAKRIGRQMLTAGGADQMVADSGPGGHSIFTWTLLQALQGKADFNNDGVITGTELAAYVAPAVSSLSSQTPAFGSLPGSEGGEFAFQAVAAPQYLDDSTPQMSQEAIALNKRIDSAKSVPKAATAPSGVPDQTAGQPKDVTVVVKTLEGKSQTIVAAAAVAAPMSPEKQAEQFNERGMQLYKEANYLAAQEAFSQALKLKPQSAMAANNLGFMLHKQGKYESAIIWFKEALKIDPTRAVAYVNMADSQLKLSDAAGAKQSCQKYLEMAPAGISVNHCKEILAGSAK